MPIYNLKLIRHFKTHSTHINITQLVKLYIRKKQFLRFFSTSIPHHSLNAMNSKKKVVDLPPQINPFQLDDAILVSFRVY